ncbi:hypothetical protein [Yersinia massiliensis]|uniref:hypothetical protein n=1 Tax=Yersinia massiliensis TaxID=419257 RepID=UPI0002DD4247|nr:hypothetical protein [Yersinia massiliensis]
MARKKAMYEVKDEGRDKGKVFILTEMSASQAELWAARALLAIGREGINIPEGIDKMGFSAIATFGLNMVMKLPFDTAEFLLGEMFKCVQIIPNPANKEFSRDLVEDDIEEITTRVKLRKAVFDLHADFLMAAAQLTSAPNS